MPDTMREWTTSEQGSPPLPADDASSPERDSSGTPGARSNCDTSPDERDVSVEHAAQNSTQSPPLPLGSPPRTPEDDGWQPVWDESFGAFYFFNSITGETTWTNPRVPQPPDGHGGDGERRLVASEHDPLQYNPAIHGDYDPAAPYAQPRDRVPAPGDEYTSVAAFNRFTGKFQQATSHHTPENYNDENKSRRQMEFYFDVDAAANSHNGKSLKAERQTKRLTKKELKEYKEKRKQRKEEKRKAWLKD